MPDKAVSPTSLETKLNPSCRTVGRFIAKGSSFALQDRAGADIWLEMDQIPLHLLDEDVEITGRHYGPSLIWVEAIGPVRSLS